MIVEGGQFVVGIINRNTLGHIVEDGFQHGRFFRRFALGIFEFGDIGIGGDAAAVRHGFAVVDITPSRWQCVFSGAFGFDGRFIKTPHDDPVQITSLVSIAFVVITAFGTEIDGLLEGHARAQKSRRKGKQFFELRVVADNFHVGTAYHIGLRHGFDGGFHQDGFLFGFFFGLFQGSDVLIGVEYEV